MNTAPFRINGFKTIVILLASLSCKKQTVSSDLTFSRACNFSGSNVEIADMSIGVLDYTDSISNLPLSGTKFVIRSSGHLPMIVCNMPSSFIMKEDQLINIKFSGRVIIIPEEADATHTDIELSYLKFE